MLRSPQVVALSCPLRSVFLRERHAAPCSRHSAAAARWPQGRSSEGVHGREGGPSLPSLPSPSLRPTQPPALSCDSDDHQRRETSLQRLFSSSVDSSCLQSPGMPTHRTVLGAAAVARRWNPRADRLWAGERQFPSARLSRARAFHAAPREEAAAAAAAWRHCLSPENEERCRQRLAPNLKLYETDRKERRGWIPSKARSQARWASVLVSLCSVAGEPAFLFTLRSCMLKGRHKGDVSFAGGKSDPSDSDVVATALREAREELGVNVSTDSVWGTLKPLRDWSGMMIAPVLANLGPVEELTFEPNPGEVEEIFTLSVSHLCNPQNCGYTHFRTGDKYGYTLPVFRNGKHRVWGLTAVALDHSLKLIVPGPRSK